MPLNEQNIPIICFYFGIVPLIWCGARALRLNYLRYGFFRWSKIFLKTESPEDYFARKDFEETERDYFYLRRRLKALTGLSNRLISEETRHLEMVVLLQKHIESLDEKYEEFILNPDNREWLQSKIDRLTEVNLQLVKLQREKIGVVDEINLCRNTLSEIAKKREVLDCRIPSRTPSHLKSLNRHDSFVSTAAQIQRSELLVIRKELQTFGVYDGVKLDETSLFSTVRALTAVPTLRLDYDELFELFDTSEIILEDLTYKLKITRTSQDTISEIVSQREGDLQKSTMLLEKIHIDDDLEERNIYRFIQELIDVTKQCRTLQILLDDYATLVSDAVYRLMLKQREIAIRIVELKKMQQVELDGD